MNILLPRSIIISRKQLVLIIGKLSRWTCLPLITCSAGASSVWEHRQSPGHGCLPPSHHLGAVIGKGCVCVCVSACLRAWMLVYSSFSLLSSHWPLWKAYLVKLLKMKFFCSPEKIQVRSIRLWIGYMPFAECILCSRDCSKYFYIHYLITFPCQLSYRVVT